jgi:hypothetical protein
MASASATGDATAPGLQRGTASRITAGAASARVAPVARGARVPGAAGVAGQTRGVRGDGRQLADDMGHLFKRWIIFPPWGRVTSSFFGIYLQIMG